MSVYSEHARNANAIRRDIAQIEADRIRRRGDFVGGTLSMLGNLPLQIMGERDARRAADQKAADEAEERDMRRRRLDYEGQRLEGDVTDRAARSAQEQAERNDALLKKLIASAPWQVVTQYAPKLAAPELAASIPPTDPGPEGRRALLQGLAGTMAAPEKPELVPTVGEGGKPVYGEKKAGAPVYERPVGQASVANPTVASLAALAATGDPTAQKALDIIKRQQAGSQSPNLVPVPGTDGKPVYGTPVAGQPVYEKPGIGSGDTAMDRQRHARTQAAQQFLNRLNTLRETINTKMGPAAGVSGTLRRGRAAIGLDPDVAEYERERAAAGRALAVAIMGAQNLSDADAKAWADMLPGATVDKETAQRLMTQVETMLTTLGGDGRATQGSGQKMKVGEFEIEVEP